MALCHRAREGWRNFCGARQCTVVMVTGDIFLCCLRTPVVLQSLEAGFLLQCTLVEGQNAAR